VQKKLASELDKRGIWRYLCANYIRAVGALRLRDLPVSRRCGAGAEDDMRRALRGLGTENVHALTNRKRMGSGIIGYCRAVLYSWPRVAVSVLILTLIVLFLSLLSPTGAYASTVPDDVQEHSPPEATVELETEEPETVTSVDQNPEVTVVYTDEDDALDENASDQGKLENGEFADEETAGDSDVADSDDT